MLWVQLKKTVCNIQMLDLATQHNIRITAKSLLANAEEANF